MRRAATEAEPRAQKIIACRGRCCSLLFFLTVLVSSSVFFTACAAGFASIRQGINQHGHYIDGVKFYRQDEDSCGPAALAALVSFWGREISPEEIRSRVYLSELRGTLPMDMEAFLRDSGFETVSSSGTLDGLKRCIRRNIPVIALLDLGWNRYRKPHYVTVIGFDETSGNLVVHDGRTANKLIRQDRFIKEWLRAGNWMLAAVPGGPFPGMINDRD